jgi:F-type H+-transporting ATPase subunit b
MTKSIAHTAADNGNGTFPPFQKETFASQLVWLALTFVLLYVLMSKVALPRVGGILATRSKQIADDLSAADRLKDQSDAAHATYEQKLQDARGRARDMVSGQQHQLAAEAEATRKRFEAELHEKLAAAEKSIAATREAAMTNVRTIAADAATAIVERLVGRAPAERDATNAVANVLRH